VGVASDHVIESFRNDLWAGYKTSEGMEPVLLEQIPLMEAALEALGVTVWAMVTHEADDALGAAALVAERDDRVTQVLICTPDKDLGQSVRGTRVVQFDRRKGEIVDEAAVTAKFGVPPASIPDWLALVGDTADGIPGLPRWGEKSAAAVLARYRRIEDIPRWHMGWDITVRGAAALADSLATHREEALLYRTLATLREDVPLSEGLDDLRWRGPPPDAVERLAAAVGDRDQAARMLLLSSR
jgi:5'-3' exonuclease